MADNVATLVIKAIDSASGPLSKIAKSLGVVGKEVAKTGVTAAGQSVDQFSQSLENFVSRGLKGVGEFLRGIESVEDGVQKIGAQLEKADDKLEDFLIAGIDGAKKLYARMTDVDSAIKTVSGGFKTGWSFVKKYAGELDMAMGAVFGVSIGGLVEKATQKITAFGAAAWEAGRKMAVVFNRAREVAGDFQAAMSKVRAIIGSVARETMTAMAAKAKELGRVTAFTANQAAQAYQFLAMAGLKAKEAIAALPGALRLAAAGDISLAEAADLATNVLAGFRMAVDQLGRVNDVLAMAASKSNTSVSELGQALRTAAPAANAVGMSIEQAVAALGGLANAGFKGAMAGTALKMMLVKLTSPSKEAAETLAQLGVSVLDSEGNFRGLIPILNDLAATNLGLAEAADIFGEEAAAAAIALMGQAREAEKLTGKLLRAKGAAEEMARVMQDNLKGAITRLESSIEGFWMLIGGPMLSSAEMMVGALNLVMDAVNGLLQTVDPFGAYLAGFIEIVGVLVAGLGGLLFVLGSLVMVWQKYMEIIGRSNLVLNITAKLLNLVGIEITATEIKAKAAALTMNGLKLAFIQMGRAAKSALLTLAANPFAWLAAVATAAVIALNHMANAWRKLMEQARTARDEADGLRGTIQDLTEAHERAAVGSREQRDAALALKKKLLELSKENTGLGDSFRKAAASIDDSTGAIMDHGQALNELDFEIAQKQVRSLTMEIQAMSMKMEAAKTIGQADFGAILNNVGRLLAIFLQLGTADFKGFYNSWKQWFFEIEIAARKAEAEMQNFVKSSLNDMIALGQLDPSMSLKEFEVYLNSIGHLSQEMKDLYLTAFVSMRQANRNFADSGEYVELSLVEQKEALLSIIAEEVGALDELQRKHIEAAEASEKANRNRNLAMEDPGNTLAMMAEMETGVKDYFTKIGDQLLEERNKAWSELKKQMDKTADDINRVAQIEIQMANNTANEKIRILKREATLGVKSKHEAELEKTAIEMEAAQKTEEIRRQAAEKIRSEMGEESEQYQNAAQAAVESARQTAAKRIEYANQVKDAQVTMLAEFKQKAQDAYGKAVDEARKWSNEIKNIEAAKAREQEHYADRIRELNRMQMSEEAARLDKIREANEKMAKAKEALASLDKGKPTREEADAVVSLFKEAESAIWNSVDKERKSSISRAKRDMEEISRGIQQALDIKKTAAQTELDKVLIRARELEKVLEKLKEPVNLSIEIKSLEDVDKVLADFAKTREELGRLAQSLNLPELKLVVDPKSEQTLQDLKKKLTELTGKVEIDSDPKKALSGIDLVKERLKDLPKKVVIPVEIKTPEASSSAPQKAEGGLLPGRSPNPRADNILAWLTAGEFIHPVDVVKHYGLRFMEAIRRKEFPVNMARMARGGLTAGYRAAARSISYALPRFSLPSFAVGGAVFSGHISPDYVYLRFLNAMDQMAMINERIAAKAADAAKMQELAAERWGGVMGRMINVGLAGGGNGRGNHKYSPERLQAERRRV